jgi:NAD(P)-dependent dehydrogenase (short-subunit alcohol dehydrogenase family)
LIVAKVYLYKNFKRLDGGNIMSLFDITDKIAVVTGASSGLGVQFAIALAKQGADIAVVARRLDRLNLVSEEIQKLGRRCIAVKCDVTNENEIINAVKTTKDFYGKIDILVNNAGVGLAEPAETQSTETWNKVIDANLNGVYLFAREVSKVMKEENYGKIINIGSIHSNLAIAGNSISAYCASKGGVLMLTKALAAEWAKYNITVNAIGPAYFESEMTEAVVGDEAFIQFIKLRCPMGRIGKPGELDGALLYLASDASSYTTGQIIYVDGGWNTI